MKNCKNLSKRLLASSLALAMCASMVCTTAFAEGPEDPQDYVYVYINVTPGTAEAGPTTPPPTFNDYVEKNGATAAPSDSAVNAAGQAVNTAETAVNDAKADVDAAASAADSAAEAVEKAEAAITGDNAFDKSGALSDAIHGAEQGVLDALKDLDATKPTFPDNDKGDPGEFVDTTDKDQSSAGTGEDKTFVQTVTDKINELNEAKNGTEEEAGTEAKANAAHTAATDAQSEFDNLNQAATDAKKHLEEAQTEATKAANAANDAVKEAQEKYDAAVAGLQKDLDDALAELAKDKPSETAPDRDSYTSQEAYDAAYSDWKTASDTYNGKVEEYQTLYAQKVAELPEAEAKAKADANLADAEKALSDAKTKLETLGAAFDTANADGKYTLMEGNSETIKAYNEALAAYLKAVLGDEDAVAEALKNGYNKNVDAYTGAAGDYNDAVDNYNNAVNGYTDENGNYVEGYNDKVDAYNQAVNGVTGADGNKTQEGYTDKVNAYEGAYSKYEDAITGEDGYNAKVGDYNSAVKGYEQSVANYNTNVVGGYNTQASNHNAAQSEKATDKLDQNVLSQLESLTTAITVAKTAVDNSTASDWSKLSDEEYNAQVTTYREKVAAYNTAIGEYNKFVTNTYNTAVDNYNAKATADKIAEVKSYFKDAQGEGHADDNGGTWYTVGRIDIKGIFGNQQKPQNILNGLDKTVADYNPGKNPNATYSDGTDKYNGGSNNNSKYKGRDIYHFFTRDEETGKVVGDPNNTDSSKNAQGFGNNVSQETEKNLMDALANGQKFEQYKTVTKTENGFDIETDVNRWVLKISYGASDYNRVDGKNYAKDKETFHLDGYVYADTLNQLAQLQSLTETNFQLRETKTPDQEKTYETKTIVDHKEAWGESTLEDVSAPEKYKEFGTVEERTVPEKPETPTWTEPTPETFTQRTLNGSATPITITDPFVPTDEPPVIIDDTTPPTDDGDTTGGDDTPAPVVVPDPEVPLVEEPVIDVPDEEVPLVEEPVVEIPEEDVPLVEIPDEDVPLAAVPKTGDISSVWYLVTLLSACGLAALVLRRKTNS